LAKCREQGIYLSSDAYSGFVKESSDRKFHEAEVAKATKYLLEEVIPIYAKDLKDKLVNTEVMVSISCSIRISISYFCFF
jgi:hypothetical protein